jgi:hypothetical protein
MASPIDVGPPRFNGKTVGANDTTFTSIVDSYSTALRAWIFDQIHPDSGGEDQIDLNVFFPSPTSIHEQAAFKSAETVFNLGNLHIVNPIGYAQETITAVLRDLIFHQAHANHGRLEVTLNGDGATNQWTRSLGTNPFYSYVDDPAEAPDLADYLETTGAGNLAQFLLRSLPSNGLRMHEVIVGVVGQLQAGTDRGLAFQVKLQHAGGQQGRTMQADMYHNNSVRKQVVKFEALDIADTTWAGVFLEIGAKRGFIGATPNPRWRLYAVDVVGYYETADVVLVRWESFADLDAAYSNFLLSFDLLSGTFRSAVLDVLKHRPELFLYLDWQGALSLGRVRKYSDAVSPLKLSTEDKSILAVQRGPYKFKERTANSLLVRWGMTIRHTSEATAQEDPVNDRPERGTRRHYEASEFVLPAAGQDQKELDRHFIRGTSGPGRVASFAASYLNMYKKHPDAIDIACSMRAAEAEPGDVVEVTIPKLNYQDKELLVVDNSFDLDQDMPILTLFDLEHTL